MRILKNLDDFSLLFSLFVLLLSHVVVYIHGLFGAGLHCDILHGELKFTEEISMGFFSVYGLSVCATGRRLEGERSGARK